MKSHSSEFKADHLPQRVINPQKMLLQIIPEVSVVQGSGWSEAQIDGEGSHGHLKNRRQNAVRVTEVYPSGHSLRVVRAHKEFPFSQTITIFSHSFLEAAGASSAAAAPVLVL